jgi:nitroimidazol reductase NimA-like FMN-containing flavoprotein (pyridoxamine 5'-phosphate oxidase superfamily)
MESMTMTPTSRPGLDRNGLEVLDREECLRLLGTATLGRIGISSGALPVILPVNFRLVGDSIVFRTASGTKLDAATRGAVVAFEVDAMDPIEHTGWSVMVTGVARQVTDAAELGIRPERIARWAPLAEDCLVAVSTDIVSGRRIR